MTAYRVTLTYVHLVHAANAADAADHAEADPTTTVGADVHVAEVTP